MFAPQLDHKKVETVESLAPSEDLSPLQQRFKDEHGLQCGFCTPAFLMMTTALARSGAPLTRQELKVELSGVMCRCTGYEFILNAVEGYLADAGATGHD
jgi:aerobic-type carbon monoxide dehydrogenase small subunit (CoxS/CutS family)